MGRRWRSLGASQRRGLTRGSLRPASAVAGGFALPEPSRDVPAARAASAHDHDFEVAAKVYKLPDRSPNGTRRLSDKMSMLAS